MKKKVLALLLGGVMAVGALFVQMPATVEAMTWEECNWHSEAHIEAYEVTTVDGQLTVTIAVEEFEGERGGFTLLALEKQLEKVEHEYNSTVTYYPVYEEWGAEGWPEEACLSCTESGTYTFTGLTSGKTYYVYCVVIDLHDMKPGEDSGEHYAAYLDSGKSTVDPVAPPSEGAASEDTTSSDPAKAAESAMISQIKTAEAGSTVVMEDGTTTLSNSVMKELLKKGDVALKLAFTYNEEEYVIVIPAGAALDNDIPWYGPLYLAQQFGNSAGTATSAAAGAGGSYEVQSGDTLSKIAAANNMTLKQLLAKNPQIKDANRITVGQKIYR